MDDQLNKVRLTVGIFLCKLEVISGEILAQQTRYFIRFEKIIEPSGYQIFFFGGIIGPARNVL